MENKYEINKDLIKTYGSKVKDKIKATQEYDDYDRDYIENVQGK